MRWVLHSSWYLLSYMIEKSPLREKEQMPPPTFKEMAPGITRVHLRISLNASTEAGGHAAGSE